MKKQVLETILQVLSPRYVRVNNLLKLPEHKRLEWVGELFDLMNIHKISDDNLISIFKWLDLEDEDSKFWLALVKNPIDILKKTKDKTYYWKVIADKAYIFNKKQGAVHLMEKSQILRERDRAFELKQRKDERAYCLEWRKSNPEKYNKLMSIVLKSEPRKAIARAIVNANIKKQRQ